MEYSTLILWSCIVSSSVFFLRCLARKLSGLPPGPVPLPLVGNLFLFGPAFHKSLAELAKSYGPVMTLQLGQVNTVVISSAEAAKEAFHKNDHALAGRYVFDAVRAIPNYDSFVAWRQPDEKWRRLRALYNTYIFSSHRLDAGRGLRKQKVEELLACLSESSKAGRAVNVGELIHTTLINLASNIQFSEDMVDLRSHAASELRSLYRSISREGTRANLVDCFPILKPFDLQGIRRRVAASAKKLHHIYDRIIEERLRCRASPGFERKNDLLDVLLDLQENGQGDGPDTLEMKAIFAELYLAATETTLGTLIWAMAELLRNPDIMDRARAEIKALVGPEKQVEEADIASLPYLRAVVKETFRLHPPGPLLLRRQTLSDVEITGFKVPKGTHVLVNIWTIGHDEGLWTEPNCFKPERFLVSKVDFRGRDFELIPFGTGRRLCPGLPLADRTVHFMLASLIHSFAWKLPDKMDPKDLDMSDDYRVTLEKGVPLLAVPVQG